MIFMNIGSKIKELRQRNNITQEELSEGLGVSPQAVSRWETAITYPDIVLLPVIANYFDVTIDDLMGMDEFKDMSKVNETFARAHNLISENRYDEAINILREALKLHPNNYGLMSDLALALTLKNSNISDLNEAIALSEKVLQKCTSEKIRSTTRANLCQLYLKVNEYDKGYNVIKSLPHIWESREFLLPELYDKDRYRLELKQTITIIINLLDKKVEKLKEPNNFSLDDTFVLGVDNLTNSSLTEKVEKIIEFLKS